MREYVSFSSLPVRILPVEANHEPLDEDAGPSWSTYGRLVSLHG
jgi:hypothetical protein